MSSQILHDKIPHGLAKRPYVLALAVVAAAGAVSAGLYMTALSSRPDAMHMTEGSTPAAASGRPVTEIKPISCTPLPDIPGKAVTVAIGVFPPHPSPPRNHHPATLTAFVLKGTLNSKLAGEPPMTYTQGQSWFEPKGAIHLFAENASKTEPASLLAMFVADENCGPLTVLLPDDHDGHSR